MNLSIFTTAFGASWAFASNVLSKVPFLKAFLGYVSGPLGAILGPITSALVDALTSVANFLLAYVKVFFDGLKVTMRNLSVLAVIFAAFVGGVAYGVHLDRQYLPVRVAKVSDCSAVIADLHKNFTFIPKKKR